MARGLRWTLLWACSAATTLLVAGWGASAGFRLFRDRASSVWEDRREKSESARLDLSVATFPADADNRIFGSSVDFQESVTVWEVGGGSIGFTVLDPSAGSAPPTRARRCDVGATPMRWRFERWRVMGPGTFYIVPLWPVVGLAVLATGAAWFPTIRSARRVRLERCGKCGYDRRGLAADSKCPECGTVAAPASK